MWPKEDQDSHSKQSAVPQCGLVFALGAPSDYFNNLLKLTGKTGQTGEAGIILT